MGSINHLDDLIARLAGRVPDPGFEAEIQAIQRVIVGILSAHAESHDTLGTDANLPILAESIRTDWSMN